MILYILLFQIALVSAGPIERWRQFEISVRDQKLEKDSAMQEFQVLYKDLRAFSKIYQFSKVNNWIFPVEGYSLKEVGAKGFKPNIRYGSSPIKGYDFYDGNMHGGHPAYDIFIDDKDSDCLDDASHQFVHVLAPVDLLILSRNDYWKPSSEIRGGNYVWALDPVHDRFYYFAHFKNNEVSEGDFCKAGRVIGTVGRTGKNAFQLRSPTHLHLMILSVHNGHLIPFDYSNLMEHK